jgi:membrane protease YdiL (CAAX protease family)
MNVIAYTSFLLLFLSTLVSCIFLLHAPTRKQMPLGFRLRNRWYREVGAGFFIMSLSIVCWLTLSLQANFIHLSFTGIPFHPFIHKLGKVFIYAGLEELLCRALLLSLLLFLLKREWIALLLSSLLFGGLHASNEGADALSLLSNIGGGLIYGLAFIRTQSLLLPLVLHFSWNALQGPVLGMNVSGEGHSGLFNTTIKEGAPWVNAAYGIEGGLLGAGTRLFILFLLLAYLSKEIKAEGSTTTEIPSRY